jgi:hypothetical protein
MASCRARSLVLLQLFQLVAALQAPNFLLQLFQDEAADKVIDHADLARERQAHHAEPFANIAPATPVG